jgi:hypothetical protein
MISAAPSSRASATPLANSRKSPIRRA